MSTQCAPHLDERVKTSTTGFETGKVVLLSAGHLIHDAYPAFLAPLIPLLKKAIILNLG